MQKISTNIGINSYHLVENLNGLQNICNSILVLYEAHAIEKQELTNLANLTYYLSWNCSKSIIELKTLLNATSNIEQDYAKGQLCVTINECIKHLIGFETDDGKVRKKNLWIKEMGKYISKHPEIEKQYKKIKDDLILYADSFEKGSNIEVVRNIAAHGDSKIDNLIKIHNLSSLEVLRYLDGLGKCMLPAANFAFNCFENECQQEMNNDNK